MAIHVYDCKSNPDHKFEIRERMDAPTVMRCPECENKADRVPSVCYNTFGWRLADSSHEIGAKDVYERNV